MPFTLIMFIILTLAGLGVLAAVKAIRKENAQKRSDYETSIAAWHATEPNRRAYNAPAEPELRSDTMAGVYGLLGLAAAFLVFSMVTFVPTRSIGVVTSFGKPVDSYSNGPHLKAPWEKVKTIDGTIQTLNRTGSDHNPTGSKFGDDQFSCTDIRIGNATTACVDNSIRWRVKLDAAQRLYKDYPGGLDKIRESLVQRQLTQALNDVLSDFNPLDAIKDKTGDVTVAPNLSDFSNQIKASLVQRVGNDIQIEDVIIPIIRFDKPTQTKINSFQTEVANTRIAQQSVKTAEETARANAKLKESVDNSPNVLVARCLDTLADMVKGKQRVPVNFTCWPGGNGSSVVLPAVK